MSILPTNLPKNPLPILCKWFEEAKTITSIPNPDAMILATIKNNNQVSARAVLCKSIEIDPGYIIFYTNYESNKGLEIDINQNVAAVFQWDELNRQVRVEGIAIRSPQEESENYFNSRDLESRIGSWTSDQSQPIISYGELLKKHNKMKEKFSSSKNNNKVPRPPNWGGYRIIIRSLELWSRGEARLHDRAYWKRSLELNPQNGSIEKIGDWHSGRLQP